MNNTELKLKIENIDVEIQKLISEKKDNHKSINTKLDKLMEEKRLIQKVQMKSSGKNVSRTESEQLFGTDMSQARQQFEAQVRKDIDRYSVAIGELENYTKHRKETLGQDMIVKLLKVKYLREKLRLELQNMKSIATAEWENSRIEVEEIQEELEESLSR
ncbi:MAG: aromatic ring-opening dioxygenase catalytic subunit (LigB family) [Flammeovirgaceae bacterium]|jgi:aromatic ring-opening dioxygenase catalytic subunit (LigB family)